MLSFIIIGRNESWKLTNCLESVYRSINTNHLHYVEVIYIDSNSSDDSLKRAKIYKNIKILQITNESRDCNAAIARNIGANASKGTFLFFIDGDMEIQPDFLSIIYSEKNGLIYPFVSGQFTNFYYKDQQLIHKENYHNCKDAIQLQYTTGGLFLIERMLWFEVNGMKNYLRIGEDIDLGLRLAKKGILLHRYSEVLAIHHTIAYTDQKRIFRDYLSGNDFYRSVLFRENFFNIYQWKLMFRQNYSSLFFMLMFLLTFFIVNPFPLILYFSLVLSRVFIKKNRSQIKYHMLPYFIIRDIGFWIAFVCFWLPTKKNISFIET